MNIGVTAAANITFEKMCGGIELFFFKICVCVFFVKFILFKFEMSEK